MRWLHRADAGWARPAIHADIQRATAAGVEVVQAPTRLGACLRASVGDPDGSVVRIYPRGSAGGTAMFRPVARSYAGVE